ncbi:Arylsulfatase A [Sphingobacterium nematocida]|uniref:Arylsulfatase A n=1 Tax=Sphingobacterium nematocida TaxID=1513896 RepID=A0A1T5AYY7_9SPHI|nr:sulfatase-like hydrolase/transferase [Sphingobacterium nematocida]SKB39823.1 Arylsulfatase A [Sphingobacterium nematocida]
MNTLYYKFALSIVALLTSFFFADLQAQHKNILIIYSDDQSYNTIRALGNNEIHTPNLDKLVRQGITFRQAHVMGGHHGAICMPSRIMMLSGRYLNRLPDDGAVVPDSIVGLPEVLRNQGYTTFHCGKWHSDKASHHRFFSTGSDIFFGGMHFEESGGQFQPYVYDYDAKGKYPPGAGRKSDTYSTELYANAAIKFLESTTAQGNPFLCYVAFTSPHDPRTPPPNFKHKHKAENLTLPPNFLPEHPFDNGELRVRDEMLLPHPRTEEAVREQIALYYDMVSEMDNQVGRILEALERSGLRESTLIVFAGDNGLAVGQHGLLGKQSLYEHSIRVPMIFSGPGVPSDKRSEAFTYLSDITPTIYDWLGLAAPSSVEAKSLKPIFKNTNASVRTNIYNIYGHWSRSIKTPDGYKLIVYNVKGNPYVQLFNLKEDPWEMHNLADSPVQQQRIIQLRTLLKKEMKQAYDDLDIDKSDWGRKPGQKAYGS